MLVGHVRNLLSTLLVLLVLSPELCAPGAQDSVVPCASLPGGLDPLLGHVRRLLVARLVPPLVAGYAPAMRLLRLQIGRAVSASQRLQGFQL